MSFFARLLLRVRPLHRLNDAASRWREGDYSARTGLGNGSELERLGQTLDRMAEALQAREEEGASCQEQLRQMRDDAVRANEAKSRFLAAASHDLRQPLQALSMGISVLEQRHRGQQQELSILTRLKRSVVNLTDLLNSLLDIAALEEGAMATPGLVDLSIDGLLATLAEDFGQPAADKGLAYQVDLCGAWVRSNPQYLARMLRTLVDYTMRLTPAGGKVHLRCGVHPERVELRVAGSGPGAFEEAGGGPGAGLASVERISRILGHAVRVESDPDKGSAFIIEIPRALAPPVPETEGTRSPSGRILLVEDDPLVAQATAALLAEWGRQVTVVASAEEALDVIARQGQAFALVIADYRLPSGSGVDVVATAILKFPHVKAAIVTADPESVSRERIVASGVHLLEKPIRASQLAELVNAVPAGRVT